ncbi:MAG: hypothetical protein JW920_08175 [Deltaproteobacteria bacterium]|nr:hypothetical protein [Deltaproteobacteria bacterium]
MILKASQGIARNFHSVDFVVLSYGPKTMITKMLYKQGDFVPLHKHPNEQSGYVLSGRYRIAFNTN